MLSHQAILLGYGWVGLWMNQNHGILKCSKMFVHQCCQAALGGNWNYQKPKRFHCMWPERPRRFRIPCILAPQPLTPHLYTPLFPHPPTFKHLWSHPGSRTSVVGHVGVSITRGAKVTYLQPQTSLQQQQTVVVE